MTNEIASRIEYYESLLPKETPSDVMIDFALSLTTLFETFENLHIVKTWRYGRWVKYEFYITKIKS